MGDATVHAAVEDRVVGALLGVHAGDSLGATTEFAAPNPDQSTWVRDVVGGGPFRWPAGAPTDDTDLTVAVVRAYRDVDHGEDLPALLDACARRFLDWYAAGPVDIGGTTASAMRALDRGVAPTASGDDHPDSQANGSLMRCVATGLVRTDPVRRRAEARAISAITHASDVCLDACAAYVDVVAALVEGVAVDDAVVGALEALEEGAPVRELLRDRLAAPLDAPLPWRDGGWVRTALDIAVWAARQVDRTAESLLVEVVNHGGDADTNGAIAGGLLGARDGVAGLPERWLAVLHLREELTEAGRGFVVVREGSAEFEEGEV